MEIQSHAMNLVGTKAGNCGRRNVFFYTSLLIRPSLRTDQSIAKSKLLEPVKINLSNGMYWMHQNLASLS